MCSAKLNSTEYLKVKPPPIKAEVMGVAECQTGFLGDWVAVYNAIQHLALLPRFTACILTHYLPASSWAAASHAAAIV